MIKKLRKQQDIKNKKELKTYILIIKKLELHGYNILKNSKSTLGIGMLKKLKKHLKRIYLLDETRTSLVSNLKHGLTKESLTDIVCHKKENKIETFIITKST
jgi:hypothetical protein